MTQFAKGGIIGPRRSDAIPFKVQAHRPPLKASKPAPDPAAAFLDYLKRLDMAGVE